jgi:transcriptional regulator with XRE-family HTH domain
MSIEISPETNRKIGARLRRLRLLLGHTTQTSFAEFVELQRHRYAQYENGSRFFTLDAALQIHSKTNCPLDYMYFGDTHGLPAFLRDLANEPTDAAA